MVKLKFDGDSMSHRLSGGLKCHPTSLLYIVIVWKKLLYYVILYMTKQNFFKDWRLHLRSTISFKPSTESMTHRIPIKLQLNQGKSRLILGIFLYHSFIQDQL